MSRTGGQRGVTGTGFKERAIALWLAEDGVPKPRPAPTAADPVDVDSASRLSKASKQVDVDELSDAWYESAAERLILDYDHYVELHWERQAVKALCSSMRLSSGVDIDEERLLAAVMDAIASREQCAAKRLGIDEANHRMVTSRARRTVDPVLKLLRAGHTPAQYVAEARGVFSVKDVSIIHEGRAIAVPASARLPHRGSIRAIDERALDSFCSSWSTRARGLCASWHPDGAAGVLFNVKVR